MKRVFLALAFFVLGHVACAEVFKDGETVCFLGDSISHGGRFHGFIYDYYLTRFPGRTIRFVNAGISGDSAGGAWGRLEEDVLAKKATSVVVMFGMNDVGRGNYVASPDERRLAAQQASLDRYRVAMDRLLGRLKGELNPRLLLATPSPFDQTAVNDRDNNQPGCNDGLGRCAGIVRELAATYGAEVVDFNGPMTAFNLERQKSDAGYTIVGPDRVHPGLPGHLMMAWLFLKAQGAPALVSKVVVDASAGKVVEQANAAVTEVSSDNGTVRFTVLAEALPFPVDAGARGVLELLPIVQDLNQEIVCVKGLPAGTYALAIDGQEVGRYAAEALAAGVNLALNDATPQMKQAAAVAKLNESRRSTETALRNFAAVRWFLRNRQVDPDDFAAVRTYAETKMAKTGYYESKVPDYLVKWETRGEIIAKVASFEREAFDARKPVARRYALSLVP